MGNLNGTAVLITRPQEQADSWLAGLAAAGAQVFHQPGLALSPSPNDEPTLRHLDSLETGTVAVFTSATAVAAGLQRQPLLAGLRCWAVGRQTARKLLEAGCREVLAPQSGAGSEALLADPRFPGGDPTLVLCAPGGRQLIQQTLAQAGTPVRVVYVYQRRPAPLAPDLPAKLAPVADRLIIVATSVAVLDHVHSLLADLVTLTARPLVVVGERIALRGRELGYRHIVVSEQPDLSSVITAVQVASGHFGT